jgi:hypothetical protein
VRCRFPHVGHAARAAERAFFAHTDGVSVCGRAAPRRQAKERASVAISAQQQQARAGSPERGALGGDDDDDTPGVADEQKPRDQVPARDERPQSAPLRKAPAASPEGHPALIDEHAPAPDENAAPQPPAEPPVALEQPEPQREVQPPG